MSPALRATRVGCVRGGRMLFKGVDVALGPGDAAMVTGPNGVGKSSLLRLLAGLLAPAAGEIVRDGRIALAADPVALDAALPLARALGFWARIDGADDRAVDRALDAMGIAALRLVPVRMLSTGQRRRASIAGVIAGGAPIWLLDEPGNGLDAAAHDALAAAIATHRAARGIVVAATHQPLALLDARPIMLAA